MTRATAINAYTRHLQFPDFEVSWVGPCPWNQGLCFGSDDGRIMLANADGSVASPPYAVVTSGEAINAVAFDDGRLAASTRAEVAFLKKPNSSDRVDWHAHRPHGAHGVIALPTGGFAAPMGPEGILLVKPGEGPPTDSPVLMNQAHRYNFYKIALLYSSDRGTPLIAAARWDGLVPILLPDGDYPPAIDRLFGDGELDFVDVCSLGRPGWPRAAAALDRDGSMYLFHDISEDTPPTIWRREGSSDGAYSILAAGGHLFVLTGGFLHRLHELADRFLRGSLHGESVRVSSLAIEAVDVYTAYEELYVVLPDEVLLVSIDEDPIAATSPIRDRAGRNSERAVALGWTTAEEASRTGSGHWNGLPTSA